jgi:hypothetical protein
MMGLVPAAMRRGSECLTWGGEKVQEHHDAVYVGNATMLRLVM